MSEDAAQDLEAQMSKSPENHKRKDYLHWDDYFMATSLLSAKRSKDPVTQVGACIVDSQNRIVAIGYNGFPRNCSDDVFPWSKATKRSKKDDPLEDKKMYVVHAEANAILNTNGMSLSGTRLYTTLFPCNECAKLIIQVGISQVLYLSDKYAYKPKYRASKRMLDAVGVEYKRHIPLKKTITIDFETFPEED
ncbi:probable deoxycytidylate deaminase [Drosophila sechellia]|uniref:Probable deoxycytidylate deaminase n=1 Tax=Drosophila sechellia TaxID=7238 RepID=B4IA66_DROSE|nr:probable deoxycytidylate deaminase [Drosophila sechellia]XP_032573173.1 probable deoxycytidylate deaminase [Drosophila sechellia]XP_032573174.1 probable deoxycytidylate deaminase [Drosophila sechellia]EDW44179.1 GM22266 [Drosophila sechellia]